MPNLTPEQARHLINADSRSTHGPLTDCRFCELVKRHAWEMAHQIAGMTYEYAAAQDLAEVGLLAPDTDKLTRLTIVNDEGRALEAREINNLRLKIQDEGRTLKIFYTKEQA